MAEKLFNEFPPISTEKWEEVITKDLKGADYDKKLVWKTMEGFSVRPYYRIEDLKNLKHIGTAPGVFPFVRGTKGDNDWLIRQGYCAHESLEKANKEALKGLMTGVTSVAFCIDGNKPLSVNDFAVLLKEIELSAVEVNFEGCQCATPEIIAAFLEYAKTKGVKADQLAASFDFDPLRVLTTTGAFCCDDFKTALKKCIDLTKDYPNIRVVGVEGYAFNDAGATIVQELGFALSMGSEYLNALIDAGFSADEAASKIKFTLSVSSNYFMEIAKFRAVRMLWANIVKAYGAKNDESAKIMVHAVTSQWNMTAYDAYVNMLRGTTEAMSASLAGVHSLEVLPFDYAIRQPAEFGNRIAKNVQILLKEESHFDKIADPAAGSYYIENLTASVAEQAWNLFTQVENKDGYIKAFKDGFIQSEIKAASQKRDMNIATKREILLGTNQYPNFTEKADKDITVETVTRGTDTAKGSIAEPLEKYRGAQAFEALRFTTENSGKTPKVFMLTFGNLAFARARAQFSSNFFAVAGYTAIDNNRFETIEEGVAAALASKAEIVVACSSDDEYAEAVPQIFRQIGDKAIVVVAGDPACKDELAAAGVKNFINVKSNLLETLKQYQALLGIK